MKRTAAKILCVVLVISAFRLSAQDRPLRFGFLVSPLTSWVKNNDNLIVENGGNVGLKLGATADVYFKKNYSFTMGFDLAFHEGGEFLYEIGGNFLPHSELSDEILQTGDKPLPDGVKIRYNMTTRSFLLALRSGSGKGTSNFAYFIEAPSSPSHSLTRARISKQMMRLMRRRISTKTFRDQYILGARRRLSIRSARIIH
jgi:hypothetical protein